MTRTIKESTTALRNPQSGIYWGVGAHPGLASTADNWSRQSFVEKARESFIVGEVGLDRARALGPQLGIFEEVLDASKGRFVSVHSTGRIDEVLDSIENAQAAGIVLHWFLGERDQVARAVRLGCFFSVNAAMPDEQLRLLPYERVLPETDFPAARRRTGASRPGDIRELESRVVRLTRTNLEDVRRHWYVVLGSVLLASGARDAAPARLLEIVDKASR